MVAKPGSRSFDYSGNFLEAQLVNQIRPRLKAWREASMPTQPVMITVCNRTETAARVKHAFDSRRIHIEELYDLERILHFDSRVLDEAVAKDVIFQGNDSL